MVWGCENAIFFDECVRIEEEPALAAPGSSRPTPDVAGT